jgi:HPt (histidine-containing phosphotransfer) domain-containing protein
MLQRWLADTTDTTDLDKNLTQQQTEAAIETLDNADSIPEMVPGINLKQGLEMMGGKVARYQKLLYLAIEQHRYTYDKIRDALEKGDHQEAQKLAHALKSVAANIGAMSLSSTAFSIEKNLKQTSPNNKLQQELLQELDLQWKQVRSSILTLAKDIRKQG